MKVKWDAVFELLGLLLSLAYIIYIFVTLFSFKVRLGYMAIIFFALSIAMFVLTYDSLVERFKNTKE